jgi:hypothetical protein
MDDALRVAGNQLARMRGMTALYHRRFFGDVRATAGALLAVFAVGFLGAPAMFAFVPFIALAGACQTAFDASYLIFARQYAARLESFINRRVGEDVLVAARLEDAYLFPLDRRKIVTLAMGGGFSWFGFMTAFITALGILAFLVGAGLAVDHLAEVGAWAIVSYLTVLALLTGGALVTGLWWFVGGEGERRLRAILDDSFGPGAVNGRTS